MCVSHALYSVFRERKCSSSQRRHTDCANACQVQFSILYTLYNRHIICPLTSWLKHNVERDLIFWMGIWSLMSVCVGERHPAPALRSESESDFSPSNSEEDEAEELESKQDVQPKTPSKTTASALYKTPSKKNKKLAEVNFSALTLTLTRWPDNDLTVTFRSSLIWWMNISRLTAALKFWRPIGLCRNSRHLSWIGWACVLILWCSCWFVLLCNVRDVCVFLGDSAQSLGRKASVLRWRNKTAERETREEL